MQFGPTFDSTLVIIEREPIIENLLAQRGIIVTHESIRLWCVILAKVSKFGSTWIRHNLDADQSAIYIAFIDCQPRRGANTRNTSGFAGGFLLAKTAIGSQNQRTGSIITRQPIIHLVHDIGDRHFCILVNDNT